MPISLTCLISAFLLLFSGFNYSYGQQSMKMFKARTFYEDNGLISNQIYTTAQSSSGELWFATPKGISTFDGIRWAQVKGSETFPAHFGSMLVALPGDSMLQLGFKPEHAISLRFYHGDSITDIETLSRDKSKPIHSHRFNGAVLKQGKQLQIVVHMLDELWMLQLPQQRWQRIKLPQELAPSQINKLIYFQNSLLVLSTKGLYSYQPSEKQFLKLWPSLLKEKTIVSATPSADGSSLYLLGDHWLAEWQDNRLQFLEQELIPKTKKYSLSASYNIVATKTGLLVIQLERALFVMNPKTGLLETFRLNDTFSTSTPTSLMEDQEGNLWFSTHRGMAMLNSLRFATMDKFMGLPDPEISSIFEIDSGTVLLGSNLGVNIYKNGQWAKRAEGDLIFIDNSRRILDVARFNDTQLLIAGSTQGLGILDQKSLVIRWHQLPEGSASGSTISWKGQVLVSSSSGKVLTFDEGRFSTLMELPVPAYIRKLTLDTENRLLILSNKGLFRYDGTATEHLESDLSRYSSIFSLLEWQGRTLLGTSNGLAVLLGDKIVPLRDSIPVQRPVYALMADKQQQLWIGTDKGIFVYSQGDLLNYSQYNGLSGQEINRHALAQMQDGRIWIGTDKGLSIYDPRYDFRRTIIPRVQLQDIRSNNGLLGTNGNYRLEHDDNKLEFNFKVLSFYYPEGLEYRYRLQGFDKYWTLSGNYLQNNVRFTNLPAGSYTFALQARVQNGPWSPVAYSKEVTIDPPLYASWWFIAAVALGLAFIGYITNSFVSFRGNERRLKSAIMEKVKQVEQSESKFQAIWESMDTGVVILNRDLNIIMANPAFHRLFQGQQESVIGKNITSLIDHNRFSKSHIDEWFEKPGTSRFELEVKKESMSLYLLATFTHLKKLAPNESLLMIGLKDISDLKQAEMKNLSLNELLVRQNRDLVKKELELASFNFELLKRQEDLQGTLKVLEERNFELDQFVYKTSHDLRAPIASSLGLLNIMKMEGMSASWPAYVDMIMRSLQKQDSFIKAMLNFSKTARADEKPELIDLSTLVEQCLNDLQYLPGYDDIDKQIKTGEQNESFYSDKMKVNIILSNIISNSIKYRDASKASSLEITITTDHKQARILIRDNGIGINKNYLEHIFKMFYRATERSDGSGLGLYIVKQTVERLGGKIVVDSELGAGSCFNIIIPNLIAKANASESKLLHIENDSASGLS